MDYLQHDKKVEYHFKSLKTDVFNRYDLKDVVKYLEDKTYLNGSRWSFKDHEVQADVLSDTSQNVNVQKCAQIGMSEAMARYGLGLMAIMPYFSVIQTMPSATDAGNFVRTRVDPIIQNSPSLRDLTDKNLNNSELKSIGSGFMYFKGTIGNTTALSVPADLLIHDEVDRSDRATLGQYQSRLKHSSWALTRKFGTPTVDKYGISLDMATSRRKRHMCKCDKCNHSFVPSFHTDVHIPGYNGEKSDITKHMLGMLKWEQAVLLCPKCGREPSLQREHREWVYENPGDTFLDIGYYISPFSFPNVVTIPKLIKEITAYESWSEFVNQALGETSASDGQSLQEGDITSMMTGQGGMRSSEVHCMGIDVGQICHVMVGRITLDGIFIVVHKERVVLGQLPERKQALMLEYSVIMTVIDSMPETYMVNQMQLVDRNLWGAVYHDNRKLATYELVKVDSEATKGKLPISQAKIHCDLNFDEVMYLFKHGRVRWAATTPEDDAVFVGHCLDMTRRQAFNRDNTMVYQWEKSKTAQDHFWHALGYLHVACRLAPTAQFRLPDEGFSLGFSVKMNEALRPGRVIGALG